MFVLSVQICEICGRISILFGWCTFCLVGALLALASGKAERRQVHPLEGNLTSVQICEICGRIHSARSSVGSVDSVGEYRFCLVGALETSAPPERQPNFCAVKSVGELPVFTPVRDKIAISCM